MKSLNGIELKQQLSWILNKLDHGQLQSVRLRQNWLILEFYTTDTWWLVVDLDPQVPQLCLISPEQYNAEIKKIFAVKDVKPISLFLNAHAKNLRVENLFLVHENDRIAKLILSNPFKSCQIDFYLIPGRVNVTVEAEGKSIHWHKPKDLPAADLSKIKKDPDNADTSQLNDLQLTDWSERSLQFIQQKIRPYPTSTVVNANKSVTNFNSTDSQANLVSTSDEATAKDAAKNEQNHWLQIEKNKIIKTIQKKKKAIQEISLQVHSEAAQNWLRFGEGLKYYQTPPEDLKELYDTSRSRSENMEKAFQKYKDLERKKTGSLQRIQILNEEIIKLENSLLNDKLLMSDSKSKTGTRQASNLMSKANVAGRKFQLEDGTEVVIGRSAKDNLNLLRKAQPTDLWLHLKDYPGSHAIVFKVSKIQNLTTLQVHQITEWLVKESLKNKSLMIGTFDVLMAEVRFVKPIKGDKLGRVTYQNEKTFTVTIKK